MNPSSLLMAFLSYLLSRISINIINYFNPASRDVRMDSNTLVVDNYTSSPSGNTASYKLVSNIGLFLLRPRSYLSTLRLLCSTVAYWYPSPLVIRTYIPIYSLLSSGVGASYWYGISASISLGFVPWDATSL